MMEILLYIIAYLAVAFYVFSLLCYFNPSEYSSTAADEYLVCSIFFPITVLVLVFCCVYEMLSQAHTKIYKAIQDSKITNKYKSKRKRARK